MAEIIGSRLGDLIRIRGTTQTAVALKIGVSQPTIGRWISGETTETGKLLELAYALRTSPEYLTGKVDDPNEGDASAPSVGEARAAFSARIEARAKDDDTVELSELDLAYGMGSTFLDDLPVKARPRAFSRAWLRNFTDSPVEKLFFAHGLGDSMSPTIMSQDILLIDTAQQSPRLIDKIWAVAMNGMGGIKRLRAMKDGGMRLMSDNPNVPDDVAYDDEMFVIGRVVAIVRKM